MSFINYFHIDIFLVDEDYLGSSRLKTQLFGAWSVNSWPVQRSRRAGGLRYTADSWIIPPYSGPGGVWNHTHLIWQTLIMTWQAKEFLLIQTSLVHHTFLTTPSTVNFQCDKKPRLLITKEFLNFLWEWFSHSLFKQNMDSLIYFCCL